MAPPSPVTAPSSGCPGHAGRPALRAVPTDSSREAHVCRVRSLGECALLSLVTLVWLGTQPAQPRCCLPGSGGCRAESDGVSHVGSCPLLSRLLTTARPVLQDARSAPANPAEPPLPLRSVPGSPCVVSTCTEHPGHRGGQRGGSPALQGRPAVWGVSAAQPPGGAVLTARRSAGPQRPLTGRPGRQAPRLSSRLLPTPEDTCSRGCVLVLRSGQSAGSWPCRRPAPAGAFPAPVASLSPHGSAAGAVRS